MTPQEIDAEAKKALRLLKQEQIATHRAVLLATLLNIRSFMTNCHHSEPNERCLYCQPSTAIKETEIPEPPPEPPLFKCPHCGAELDHVYVYSRCFQIASLSGNQTVDYDSPDILETEDIICPKCSEYITEHIKEC